MTLPELQRLQGRLVTILAEVDYAKKRTPMLRRIESQASEALKQVESELDAMRNTP